jgi:hypothetical protein
MASSVISAPWWRSIYYDDICGKAGSGVMNITDDKIIRTEPTLLRPVAPRT